MTFVLQGGEDPYYTDDRICDIVRAVKTAHPGLRDHLIGRRERAGEFSALF
jgi:biotin synthase